ncbi:hypothetical protein [Aegicerativicinus sediminis]
MRITLLITILLLNLQLFAQNSEMQFDKALDLHLPKYIKNSNAAIENYEYEKAEMLFDSLFQKHLRGSLIPNLTLNRVKGDPINTDDLGIPFIIITRTPWMLENEDEVALINDIALKYSQQIAIIVLYWSDEKVVKKASKAFSKDVILTYVDERDNKNNLLVKTFKHSFGAPTCFFVDQTKHLMHINKKFSLMLKDETEYTFDNTYKNLALLLFKDENTSEGVITTLDEDNDPDY